MLLTLLSNLQNLPATTTSPIITSNPIATYGLGGGGGWSEPIILDEADAAFIEAQLDPDLAKWDTYRTGDFQVLSKEKITVEDKAKIDAIVNDVTKQELLHIGKTVAMFLIVDKIDEKIEENEFLKKTVTVGKRLLKTFGPKK